MRQAALMVVKSPSQLALVDTVLDLTLSGQTIKRPHYIKHDDDDDDVYWLT